MRVWLVAVAAVMLGSPVARAQMDSREAIQLQNEILELRHDLQVMRQNQGSSPSRAPSYSSNSDSDSGNGLTAQLLDRVSTLEDQVRELRGQVDRLTNQQQRQAEDFNKQIADLNFTLQNAGQGQAPANPPPRVQGPATPAPSVPPPAAALPPRTPEMAMQEGNAALARRDYAAAEAAAKEVIAKRGPRQADAQFLLAQAEMGERNFAQAAPDFYDAYNRSRTGPHAADSLLGLANSLIMVGEKASACEALAKLRTEFPQPRPDQREAELSARQRAACHS